VSVKLEIGAWGGGAKQGWSFEGISAVVNCNSLPTKKAPEQAENYWEDAQQDDY